jgi:hypothetical protein
MHAICSYCEADLGQREPLDDPRVTHSICEPCFEHFEAQWNGQHLAEFMDRYDTPMVAVTPDRRVIAINAAMSATMGIGSREAAGLLGGEFMECEHARLPERCGHTVHCSSCTIRSAVEHTTTTGEDVPRRPAILERDRGTVHMFISTTRRGAWVQLVIEPVTDEA